MALYNQEETYFAASWPLLPFHLVQNEAVSFSSTVDKDKEDIGRYKRTEYEFLPIPAKYFQNNSNFRVFRRFVLLLPPMKFENGNYKSCDFLRPIMFDSFQSASRLLENRFDNSPINCHQPVKTCRECIASLYSIIPQKLNTNGLFVSEFLVGLKNKKKTPRGFKRSESNHFFTRSVIFQQWGMNLMLWVAGESLFQAKQIWWGKFGLEILKEGKLTAPITKNTTYVLGPISFFYDECPDLIYGFFIDPKCSPELARHIHGLMYAMKEARKAWLFDWVGRLAETIMKMEDHKCFAFLKKYQHLKERYEDFTGQFSKSPDTATKLLRVAYAREALEWMARVLAFFETSPENAVLDQTTFLDYNNDDSLIAISGSVKLIV